MHQPHQSAATGSSPLFRLLLVSVLAVFLSACTMRALVGVDVSPDGSGVFEVSMAFDEELRTLMEEESSQPIDWSDPEAFEQEGPADLMDELPEGASVSPYSEGGFQGFTVSVEFSSLEELEGILAEASSEGEEAFPFRIAEPREGRFELSTHGDIFGDSEPAGDELEMIPSSMLEELFDMQLQVRLPGEVISTNADETSDEGVMIWRLNPMEEDPVRPEAVSEVPSSSLMPVLALIAVLVAGAAVATVIFLRRGTATASQPASIPTAPPEGSEGTA